MRKINNINQLNVERKHLEQRQSEIEKALKHDFRDVKDSLMPKNIIEQIVSKVFDEKSKENAFNVIEDSFSKLFTKVSKNIFEKISKWFVKKWH